MSKGYPRGEAHVMWMCVGQSLSRGVVKALGAPRTVLGSLQACFMFLRKRSSCSSLEIYLASNCLFCF